MHATKLVVTGFFCFLLALRALGAQQAEARAGDEGPSAPASAQFSIVPQEDGWIALGDLLRRFEEVADQTLALDEETNRIVEQTKLFASASIAAEPEAVVPVVESVLAGLQFYWTVMREEPPGILALRSLGTTARAWAREGARFVPVEELARYAEHPARLVQVIVSLPRTDVNTLANSMRTVVVDPNILQIIPVGSGSELLLQGTGRVVFDLVAMLREVDRWGAPEPAEPGGESHPVPLPTAEGTYTLGAETEGGFSLLALVIEYARATGQVAVLNEESHRLLEHLRLPLSRPLTVAGADFPTLCEDLLRESAFVIGELHRGTPSLFTVRSLDTTARGTARQDARYVDSSSLADCAKRPATLFTTLVHLPHTDVRTLSNSMRSMVVDPNLLQLVPVGNSNSLILQGRGRELVDLVAMLREVDRRGAPEPAEPRGESHPLPLPTAEGTYTLGAETEGGSSLLALVIEYARATGQVAVLNEESRRLLEQIRLPLSRPLTVAGADFPTLCEELLRESAFVIGEFHRGTPRLFTVRSLDTTARGTARQDARYVDSSALADCAKRPATLFTTLVHLPHTDVRTVSNSMRSMVIDPNLLQIVPVGNSNSLILQGRGRELVDLVAMLHAIDAAAAAAPPVPTPPAGGSEGEGEGQGQEG